MTDLLQRWEAKVDRNGSNGCWLWIGAPNRAGYGTLSIANKPHRAHRVGYELLVGPIPEGLQLDHLCRVRHCVNPDHLEPVTPRENTRRGVASELRRARYAARTHCVRGHSLTGDNVIPLARGGRRCRACQRHRDREAWRKTTGVRPTRGPRRDVVERLSPTEDRLSCGHRVIHRSKPGYRTRRCYLCDQELEQSA